MSIKQPAPETITAARGIVDTLRPLQQTSDLMIAQSAHYLAELSQCTIDAQIGMLKTHGAILAAATAVNSAIEARSAIVASQKKLIVIRKMMGLEEVGVGSLPGCPPKGALQLVDGASRAA